MGKWDDDIPLLPAGSVAPTTTASLVRSLGLVDAPTHTKAQAIKQWLRAHEPSETLIMSLGRAGYAQVLSELNLLGTPSVDTRNNRRAVG